MLLTLRPFHNVLKSFVSLLFFLNLEKLFFLIRDGNPLLPPLLESNFTNFFHRFHLQISPTSFIYVIFNFNLKMTPRETTFNSPWFHWFSLKCIIISAFPKSYKHLLICILYTKLMHSKILSKQGVVAQICNPSGQEAKAEWLQI